MALITLTEAKTHLRISGTDQDTDVTQKAAAASAAVLRYIGGRRIVVSTLTSSGGVATLTTAVPHALTTNDVVEIWGALQPEYNGSFAVVVIDSTSFSYAVSGTPETPATGSIGLSAVPSWTDVTVPADVKHAVFVLLTSFYENRGESGDGGVWKAVESLVSSYRKPALS